MKELEEESRRLKKRCVDARLSADLLTKRTTIQHACRTFGISETCLPASGPSRRRCPRSLAGLVPATQWSLLAAHRSKPAIHPVYLTRHPRRVCAEQERHARGYIVRLTNASQRVQGLRRLQRRR